MNKRRMLVLVVGIVLLIVLALDIGKRIGGSIHGDHVAAAGNTPISSPVDFFSGEFSSFTDIVPISGLAVGGLGDALLKSNVWRTLLDYEQKQNCTAVTSKAISVEQINEADEYWVEDWTVNACGQTEVFKIKFYPGNPDGTTYEIYSN